MSALSLALGMMQPGRATGFAGQSLRLSALPDGTIEIEASGGQLALTLSGGTPYDGTHAVLVADLAQGPVALVAPGLAGEAVPGGTLTATPALWLYDIAGGVPGIAQAWLRDESPIAEATALSYTLLGADAGHAIALRETATSLFGSRVSQSEALVPAA